VCIFPACSTLNCYCFIACVIILYECLLPLTTLTDFGAIIVLIEYSHARLDNISVKKDHIYNSGPIRL